MHHPRRKEEVKSPILMMAKDYGQAKQMIIRLGEASNGSDLVLEHVRNAGTSLDGLSVPNQDSLRELLARPWFCRIWVN